MIEKPTIIVQRAPLIQLRCKYNLKPDNQVPGAVVARHWDIILLKYFFKSYLIYWSNSQYEALRHLIAV